jgi:hypothetical protein
VPIIVNGALSLVLATVRYQNARPRSRWSHVSLVVNVVLVVAHTILRLRAAGRLTRGPAPQTRSAWNGWGTVVSTVCMLAGTLALRRWPRHARAVRTLMVLMRSIELVPRLWARGEQHRSR